MKQIGWREANKKIKIIDRECPEWLWITIFILFITGAAMIMYNFPKFNPAAALAEQTAQLDDRTPARGQILPKNEVVGVSSWYDYSLNGIKWSESHNTCATRDFKRYSTIRVTNLDNGKSVECYVNDFGPELGQMPERHIDLSSHAFSQIADLKLGLINVKIEEL